MTENERVDDAVGDRALNCCGSTEGHRPNCQTVQRTGLLDEDRSDIRLVPDAVREMWDPNSRRARRFRER